MLCLEYKVVSVPYFLDEMQSYEVYPLMDHLHFSVRTSWDQTRHLMRCIISPYTKKKNLQLKDIIEMPWDKENPKEKEIIEYTKEMKEAMIKKAEAQKTMLQSIGAL